MDEKEITVWEDKSEEEWIFGKTARLKK
jgi:hypothetical protein